MNYQDINAETIDRWIRDGWEWGKPISHETFEKAKKGEWDVFLTPTKPVPHAWFGDLAGKKVLGLASGGGQQMPVFAALGADCTILDYSPLQLESERLVAEREGYPIRIVRGDMTKRLPFDDAEFDLVFHPVSNCYVEEVRPIWKECFRVLKPGGILLSGTDHFVNYIVDADETRIVNSLPFNPLKDPDQMRQLEADDAGVQFSHSLEEQIDGQLEAGFVLTDLYEDTNGEGRLHELNIPTFLAMRARKPDTTKEKKAIDLARALAKYAHEGQVDKSGKPYFSHPETVANSVEKPEEKIVAYLHDTIEDTFVTEEVIRTLFGDEIADAVLSVTKREGEDYMDFVRRAKANPIGRVVKTADIRHNMDLSRISHVTDRDLERIEKYRKALAFLID